MTRCIVHSQVCGLLLLLWLGSEQFWVTGEESSVYDGRWSRAPDQTQPGGGAVLLYPIQHGWLPDSPHQLFGRGGTWVTFDLSLNLVSHTQLSRMLNVSPCVSSAVIPLNICLLNIFGRKPSMAILLLLSAFFFMLVNICTTMWVYCSLDLYNYFNCIFNIYI